MSLCYPDEENEPAIEPTFELLGSFLPFPVRSFQADEGISPWLAFQLWESFTFANKADTPVGNPVAFSIVLKFLLDAFIHSQIKLAFPDIRLNGYKKH